MQKAEIDTMRGVDGALYRSAVMSLLPYGDEFLFIDMVSVLTVDEVVAYYRVPTESPIINAHFVHSPVMPGVLLGEALAQVGILLLHYRVEFVVATDILVNSVRKARFKSPAVPGDLLQQNVKVTALNTLGARLEGRSYVGTREVCMINFDVTFVDREKMADLLSKMQSEG